MAELDAVCDVCGAIVDVFVERTFGYGRSMEQCTNRECERRDARLVPRMFTEPVKPTSVTRNATARFDAWLAANPPVECECGCGQLVKRTKYHFYNGITSYILGHKGHSKPKYHTAGFDV